jgi:hypothetical protein
VYVVNILSQWAWFRILWSSCVLHQQPDFSLPLGVRESVSQKAFPDVTTTYLTNFEDGCEWCSGFKYQSAPAVPDAANNGGGMTARERLRMHLVQALTRSSSQDVRKHLRAALCEWENLPPTPLEECAVCGRLGLPERIADHRCGVREERL